MSASPETAMCRGRVGFHHHANAAVLTPWLLAVVLALAALLAMPQAQAEPAADAPKAVVERDAAAKFAELDARLAALEAKRKAVTIEAEKIEAQNKEGGPEVKKIHAHVEAVSREIEELSKMRADLLKSTQAARADETTRPATVSPLRTGSLPEEQLPDPEKFEMHQLDILLCDETPTANDVRLFNSALPPGTPSERPANPAAAVGGGRRDDWGGHVAFDAPSNEQQRASALGPAPGGILTFRHGWPRKIEVKLADGATYAAWPVTDTRGGRNLVWVDGRSISTREVDGKVVTEVTMPSRSPDANARVYAAAPWIADLDNSDASLLMRRNRQHARFAYYDYSIPNPKLAALRFEGDRVSVESRNVLQFVGAWVFRKEGDGFRGVAVEAGAALPTGEAKAVDFTKAVKAEDAIAALAKGLRDSGFSPQEAAHAAAVVRAHGLDPMQTTLVVRLDPRDMEPRVTVTTEPAPAKTIRAALLIFRGADPRATVAIESLITRLGDPSWKARQEATEKLIAMGPSARTKLQAASQSKDPEVALRVERILEAIDRPTAPR